jgi:hypothetical protein
MLIVRSAPRAEHSKALKHAMTFNILDDGQKVGQVVGSRTERRGLITLRGESYTTGRAKDEPEIGDIQKLMNMIKGVSEKTEANPLVLKNTIGTVLAVAEETQRYGYIVTQGGDVFRFRPTALSTEWHLYREDDTTRLGGVLREGWFSLNVLLRFVPGAVNEVTQIFLFWLRLDAEWQSAD